jgi:hypothetical protein
MGEIKVKVDAVYYESSEELVQIMNQYFMTESEKQNDDDEVDIYVDVNFEQSDALPIPIGIMKQMIQDAEDKGANFICVDFHCDHMEYDIYGLKIDRLDEVDVEKLNKQAEIKAETERLVKIAKLQNQINELSKNGR